MQRLFALCGLIALHGAAAAQAPTLPSFKSFVEWSDRSRADLDVTALQGMRAHVLTHGSRCFADEEIEARESDGTYILEVKQLMPNNPGNAAQASFCKERSYIVKLPKAAGAFGSVGAVEIHAPEGTYKGRVAY